MVKVFVRLKGGLGNQLFQWYFAHTLPATLFVPEVSSFSHTDSQRPRRLELAPVFETCNHFDKRGLSRNGHHARSPAIISLLARMWGNTVLRQLSETLGYVRDDFFTEVNVSAVQKRRIVYLDGYFQDFRLIKDIYPTISKEMKPILEKKLKVLKQLHKIPKSFDVIHVRRADFIGALKNYAHIGILNDSWFRENYVNNSNFLIILSEDKEECRELVEYFEPHLVLDGTNSTPWDVLTLLTYAENSIGSNSTLSWWGALMSRMNGNSFVMPDNWSWRNNVENQRFFIEGINYRPSIWFEKDSM